MRKEIDQFDLEAESEGSASKRLRSMVGTQKFFAKESTRGERFFVKRLSEVVKSGKGVESV